MSLLSSVALVTCALLFFENADSMFIASSENSIEGQERMLNFPNSFSFNATMKTRGDEFNYGIWISEPLNAIKSEIVKRGLIIAPIENLIIMRGNEGTHGTFWEYSKLNGHEVCKFGKGTASMPLVVESKLINGALRFEDVEIANGEKIEKWVHESKELSIEYYINRSAKEPVPVRIVISGNSLQSQFVIFDIKEYSSRPVLANAFEYDSKSYGCTEMKVKNEMKREYISQSTSLIP